ncbi:MAG: MGMT family protein [Rudanella sp.]|nr:MGMT family protein [Rudanella sp.]
MSHFTQYYASPVGRLEITATPEAITSIHFADAQKKPGQTITYGQQAIRLDNPKAARAVGLCNGNNPIVLLVPCHRVIGANGSLTGFGGDLWVKKWLLDHEKKHSSPYIQTSLF